MKLKNSVKILFAFLLTWEVVYAQKLDVPYVPTPLQVVDRMLQIANVGAGDYVIDLGSGDGRIVIAAAQKGAYAHGVEIDPKRITEANVNAKKMGVDHKVLFLEESIFDSDISNATVITMYLLTSVNKRLKPIFLKQLKPGTQIVSHSFSMGDWEPDLEITVLIEDMEDYGDFYIYYWIVPAQIAGNWTWVSDENEFYMQVDQKYQNIALYIASGKTKLDVSDVFLKGSRIGFVAKNDKTNATYVFNGTIEKDTIIGVVQIRTKTKELVEKWSAIKVD
jgi:SAM-dependent methyltransferase